MTANITFYTRTVCPYCVKAKALLKSKGFEPRELINIDETPERAAEMVEKSGGRKTVPQIFINGQHIGGCDDLFSLHEKGELDPLLGRPS